MFSIKDYSVFFDGCSVCALPCRYHRHPKNASCISRLASLSLLASSWDLTPCPGSAVPALALRLWMHPGLMFGPTACRLDTFMQVCRQVLSYDSSEQVEHWHSTLCLRAV